MSSGFFHYIYTDPIVHTYYLYWINGCPVFYITANRCSDELYLIIKTPVLCNVLRTFLGVFCQCSVIPVTYSCFKHLKYNHNSRYTLCHFRWKFTFMNELFTVFIQVGCIMNPAGRILNQMFLLLYFTIVCCSLPCYHSFIGGCHIPYSFRGLCCMEMLLLIIFLK